MNSIVAQNIVSLIHNDPYYFADRLAIPVSICSNEKDGLCRQCLNSIGFSEEQIAEAHTNLRLRQLRDITKPIPQVKEESAVVNEGKQEVVEVVSKKTVGVVPKNTPDTKYALNTHDIYLDYEIFFPMEK